MCDFACTRKCRSNRWISLDSVNEAGSQLDLTTSMAYIPTACSNIYIKRILSICLNCTIDFNTVIGLACETLTEWMCNAKYSYWYVFALNISTNSHLSRDIFTWRCSWGVCNCIWFETGLNEAIQNAFSFDIEVVSGRQTHKHLAMARRNDVRRNECAAVCTHTNCIDLFPITWTCFYWIWAHN